MRALPIALLLLGLLGAPFLMGPGPPAGVDRPALRAPASLSPHLALSADAGPDRLVVEGESFTLVGSASPATEWTTVWTDDFESYLLGPLTSPWIDESTGGTNYAEISSAIVRAGSRSMRLVDTTGGPTGLGTTAARPVSATIANLTAWVYALQTTGAFTPILSAPGGTAEWQMARAGMGPTAQFIYDVCPPGWSTSPVPYGAATWYEITLAADIGRGEYDLYVDGALVASGVPLCGTSSLFDAVRLVSAGSYTGEFFVDDVTYREGRPVPVVDYSWDLNALVDGDSDGNPTNDRDLAGPSGTVAYGDDGDYVVTLTVMDEAGSAATDTATISVRNEPPATSLSLASPISLSSQAFLVVDVLDAGSDDVRVGWAWDDGPVGNRTFRNGVSADPPMSPNGTFPFAVGFVESRTFPGPGTYGVVVTAEDDDGGVTLAAAAVEVRDVPMTRLVVGSPSYSSGPTYVNGSTPLSFTVTDRSGLGVNATYYQVDSGPAVQYAAPFSLAAPGSRTLTYWSTDLLGGIETPNAVTLYVDVDPPTTTVEVTGPEIVRAGTTWIAPSSRLALVATDGGSGVAATWYRVWDGVAWSAWMPAPMPPTPPVPAGPFALEFYSTDNLGQSGAVSSLGLAVDGTPPTSTIAVGQPSFDPWISPATPLTLGAADEGVGLDSIRYRVWHDGSWSPFSVYATPFRLGPGDGLYHVEYDARDLLGNAEPVRNLTLRVDGTPPDLSAGVVHSGEGYAVTVTLEASDTGSGVARIEYRIDAGPWIAYEAPFPVEGRGPFLLAVRAWDRVDNVAEPEPRLVAPRYANQKPLLSVVLAAFLLLAGLALAWARPRRRRGIALVVAVFAGVELALGVASALLDILLFPPVLGAGLLVNLTIAGSGLAAILALGRREKDAPAGAL